MKMLNIFVAVYVLFCALLFLLLVGAFYIWFKNENTYKQHELISHAIWEYRNALIREGKYDSALVNYPDMESYEATLFRLWDWGYTRILPKEKFEIIKPYIE